MMLSTRSTIATSRALPRAAHLKVAQPSKLVLRAAPEGSQSDTAKQAATTSEGKAIPAAATTTAPSLNDVMGFGGSVPEIANGRLAMLGFVAAVAAELSSGDGVLRQWAAEPTGIAITFLVFIAASLVPAFKGQKPETFGPFTPKAEILNGRAAMIGFAALLAIETIRGYPLF